MLIPMPDDLKPIPTNQHLVFRLINLEQKVLNFSLRSYKELGDCGYLENLGYGAKLFAFKEGRAVDNLYIDPSSVKQDNFDMPNCLEEDSQIVEKCSAYANTAMRLDTFLKQESDKNVQNDKDILADIFFREVEFEIQELRRLVKRYRVEKNISYKGINQLRDKYLKYFERNIREFRRQLSERRTDNYPRYSEHLVSKEGDDHGPYPEMASETLGR